MSTASPFSGKDRFPRHICTQKDDIHALDLELAARVNATKSSVFNDDAE